MKHKTFAFQFVEFIPKQLEEGVLYISIPYSTVSHRCFCGCGMKVVTPLTPTDWRLIFNGDTVSLEPSIGNWSYPCRSHYVLRGNRVLWAGSMSQTQIEAIRARDRASKVRYYGGGMPATEVPKPTASPPASPPSASPESPPRGLWQLLGAWLAGGK